MATPLALVWDLIARDNATATFNRVGTAAQVNAARIGSMGAAAEASSTRLGKASKAMESVVGIGAKLGLTLGAAAFAFEAFKEGSAFQKQMLQIQTLTGGTAAEVRDMSKAVLNLSGQVATAPDALALSLYHVESVGLRGAAAMNVVEIAAKGAKIGMANLEETTNALTSTVASGIPGVENMSQAMGALLTIVGAGDMKVSDLNEALGGGILSVVKGYGLSLNDVGAALATFGDNNIRGADAATALRMAVQSLAVPAKTGKNAIESIGLSMQTLQKDMQTGGLNKALLDLNTHLKQAGITGVQIGGFLTEAFGKRAGIGLSVLMGQLDRFESKVVAIKDGSAGFADKWTETTHTVGYAFDNLRTMIEKAGVQAFEAVGPAVGGFVNMLATDIPAAVRKVADTLAPMIHIVEGGFVAAWHGAADILRVAESALSGIGSVLASHKMLVNSVAVAVLGMWAAFKTYTLAVAAIRVVASSMETLALKAMYARDAIVGMSATTAAAGGALAVFGAVLVGVTMRHQEQQRQTDLNTSAIKAYTAAIEEDNGALGAHVRSMAEDNLASAGAYQLALKMGINQKTLTDAMLGNAGATRTVSGAIADYAKKGDAGNTAAFKLSTTLAAQGFIIKSSITDAHDKAAADDKVLGGTRALSTAVPKLTQYQKDLATAMGEEQVNIDGVTYAMDKQKTAADILTAAIAVLSGDKNAVAEQQLALADSLNSVTKSIQEQAKTYKDSGTSLNANTEEGRKNLEWMHQQIDAINSVANSQIKAGASNTTVTSTLKKNEDALRAAAVAAGLNSKQVDALIKGYAAMPAQVNTYLIAHTDAAATKALALKAKLDDLRHLRTAPVVVNDKTGVAASIIQRRLDDLTMPRTIPITLQFDAIGAALNAANSLNKLAGLDVHPHATGGNLSPGWNLLGDGGGPELVNRETGKILTAGQTRQKLASGGTTVNIAKQELHVHYPLEGGLNEALPNLMRAAQHQLGNL